MKKEIDSKETEYSNTISSLKEQLESARENYEAESVSR